MVSTATPADRPNCSIRYSMSTYSKCLGGWSSDRVPVIHAIEPSRVGAVGPREGLHRVDVVVIVVVLEDRVAHVVRRAVVREVASRREDGVMRVIDVPALPVFGPGAGKELHRSLRIRG